MSDIESNRRTFLRSTGSLGAGLVVDPRRRFARRAAAPYAVITPESLRDGTALAFEATVDRIEGDQVYSNVDTRYVGDVAESARIPQQRSDLPRR